MRMRPAAIVAVTACALAAHASPSLAQNRGGGAPQQTAKAAAPVDLTGYWVAFVSEDWRYRMLTPPKGDLRGVPLTPEGTRVANAWNPATPEPAAEQCKAYGAPAVMRIPGRLHITWQDDNTMRLETDAGMQTRLFRFAAAGRAGESGGAGRDRTWQGDSSARWDRAGGRGAAASGSLAVVTTNLRAGYLRKNGIPYSENAAVTEYFDVAPLPGGGQLLIVTTEVTDPRYLQRSYIVSSHFKKEADASKWDPTPCSAF